MPIKGFISRKSCSLVDLILNKVCEPFAIVYLKLYCPVHILHLPRALWKIWLV